MSEDEALGRTRVGGGKQARAVPYTSKDFQLEVLGQLAEVQALTESLLESLRDEAKTSQERAKLLKFDGRTLVAIGALALSMTGYVLQDARNSSKRDAEIETTRTRVTNLERVAEVNTEGRIRTEVQLLELRAGQAEIKTLIEAQVIANKKALSRK
jgi:hypothetical protein